MLVSLATALVFGILPALHLSRLDVVEVVRDTGRTTTAGPARSRLRGAFVVAQVGLALVLLMATGLMTRSLLRLNAVDTGLTAERLIALQIPMPRALYRNTMGNTPGGGLLVEFDSRFSDMTERLRERFAAVPGVESVAASTPPPARRCGAARAVPQRLLVDRRGRSRALVRRMVSGQRGLLRDREDPAGSGTCVHAPGRTSDAPGRHHQRHARGAVLAQRKPRRPDAADRRARRSAARDRRRGRRCPAGPLPVRAGAAAVHATHAAAIPHGHADEPRTARHDLHRSRRRRSARAGRAAARGRSRHRPDDQRVERAGPSKSTRRPSSRN